MNERELISAKAAALLNLRRLPARLDAEQTAALLGHKPCDIPVLIRARLLKPLGRPPSNAPKWFATVDVLNCFENRQWLHRASSCITDFWKEKNSSRIHPPAGHELVG